MILKTTLSALTLTLLASPAFAHSDYWRCAAASGSNEAAAANCGSREDYDRTGHLGGANTPSPQQIENERRQQEQQREEQDRQDRERRDEQDRQERNRRDEQDRQERNRRDEEERRQRDEEYQRNNSSSDDSGSYRPSRPTHGRPARPVHTGHSAPAPAPAPLPRHQAPVVVDEPAYADDIIIPLEVNQQLQSLNVGLAANLDAYDGLKIKSIKVEASTTGNSQVDVFVAGARVGGIKAIEAGEYEKDFAARTVIRSSQKNLMITTSGDVTILRVTVTVGK